MWLTGLVAPRHVGSSQTRARTRVPCISRQILNHCATREALHLFLIIFFLFFIIIALFYFILSSFFLSFYFFLPFILSHVDERLLVLQPGIRAVPLRWESQLQDTGPQETSQLHVTPNGENLSEISISTSIPSFTQRPASYSAGQPMANN